MVERLQQSMVAHKLNERHHGKLSHALVERRRPNRRGHWQEVVVGKGFGVAMRREVRAHRHVTLRMIIGQAKNIRGHAVEAHNVEKRAKEGGRYGVAPLRKHRGQVLTCPLKAAEIARDLYVTRRGVKRHDMARHGTTSHNVTCLPTAKDMSDFS